MKNIRFLILVVLIVALAVPSVGFAQDDEQPLIGAWDSCPTPENLSGEISIGVTFSLTEGAAIYGEPQSKAVEYAVSQINDSGYLGEATLNAIFEDAASNQDSAIAAVTKLVEEDEVVAIIGPTLSNQAVAADPIAMEAGVVVLGVSNTASGLEDTIGEYYFRDSLPESKVIPGTVAAATEILGLERVAVMYSDNDAFTVSGYEVFMEALDDNDVEVVIEEVFKTGDVDFTSQLINIVAEDPDAIVVSGLFAEAVPLLEQIRQQGYEGPVIGGNGFNSIALGSEENGAGSDANGVIVGAAWNAALQNESSVAFTTVFTEEYGLTPDQFSVQAYTGAWILATAIRCADAATSDDIKAQFEDFAPLETPLGEFTFDEAGLPEHTPATQIMLDGSFQILDEETAAEVFGE